MAQTRAGIGEQQMPNQITIPETATVSIRKANMTINALRSWPQASLDKVFAYGLQQILNDAAAPAGKDAARADIEALVLKRVDNLSKGVMRASFVRTSDPVAVEALRIATERVVAAAKAKNRKLDAPSIRKLAIDLVAKRPDITATAKANVEARDALDIDIDIPDDIAE